MRFAADQVGAKYRDAAADHRVLAEMRLTGAKIEGLDIEGS